MPLFWTAPNSFHTIERDQRERIFVPSVNVEIAKAKSLLQRGMCHTGQLIYELHYLFRVLGLSMLKEITDTYSKFLAVSLL